MMTPPMLAELAAKIERLDAIDQIRQLASKYAIGIDMRDMDAIAGLYVEDIFVVEDARQSGAGRALLEALARLAVARAAPRIDLVVLDWNSARAFYERLGFTRQHEWLPYRLDAAGIAALAGD